MQKNDWKQQLRQMKLEHIKAESPAFFGLSGGYKMKINPYKEDTANGLTRAIIDWLNYSGCYANRINVQGQVRKETIQLIQGNSMEKIHYTPSTTNKGTADISAIVNGRHWSVEVKIGKDRMSLNQLKEMVRVNKAGGVYFVARDMPSFVEFYHKQIVKYKEIQQNGI